MSEQNKEVDDPVARFLAEGGKITQGAYKESGRAEGASINIWSRKPGRPKSDAPAIIVVNQDKE